MSVDSDDARVVDNPASRRFELWVGDELAGVLVYRSRPGARALVHTEIYDEFEGRGLGGKLVTGVLNEVRGRGLGVIPICPFVRSYLERHPEQADLVVPGAPQDA
jgi:uncharacterized protein